MKKTGKSLEILNETKACIFCNKDHGFLLKANSHFNQSLA